MFNRYGLPVRTLLLGIVCAVFVFVYAPGSAESCTTFCLDADKGAVIGKSYDFHFGEARLYTNKRGVGKQAVVLTGKAANWTSKYASLSFNQFGREFPNGGINEKGLVVEVMTLEGTEFPAADDRPAVNELQWIQYQLDQHATVKEVMANADKIRVSATSKVGDIHYMVCDKSGACATFEYLKGKLKKTSGKELTVPVLTNHSYADSRAHLKSFQGFGGKKPLPTDAGSLSRFVIAAKGTQTPGKDPVAAALETLDKVRNGDFTKWNIVYDTGAMKVHFRSLNHDAIKVVDLKGFFSDEQGTCKTPVKMLDINIDVAGDVTNSFYEYSTAENLRLAQTTMGRVEVPPSLIALAGSFPDALPCTL